VAPPQYREVLRYGIGMTDLCKSQSGSDATLDPSADDPARVMRLVRRWRPKSLAFNGKRAAAVFFGARVAYGRQPAPIDETAVFVLPSTAGLAGGAWDIGYWRALARFVG
jgi:TDG/mug DNA glycosylase family protein